MCQEREGTRDCIWDPESFEQLEHLTRECFLILREIYRDRGSDRKTLNGFAILFRQSRTPFFLRPFRSIQNSNVEVQSEDEIRMNNGQTRSCLAVDLNLTGAI
jgi:hypothetical protein